MTHPITPGALSARAPSEERIAREMHKAGCSHDVALEHIAANRARLVRLRLDGGLSDGNPWGPINKLARRYRDWLA